MVGRPKTIHSAKHAILCVDDERELLEALALTLGHLYFVEMAAGGSEALDKLSANPKISVIISDMCMPHMNGAHFLQESRRISPDARRIVLSGQSDIASAIAAVNDGRVFRYLTKPCESAELIVAVDAAIADFEAEMGARSAIRRSVEREMLGVDRLTGLASRDGLLERLCLLQTQRAEDCPAVVFLVDIADPPDVAENYDSPSAEAVLCVMAERLKSAFDIPQCLARSGPKSLVAVLTPDSQSETALQLLGLKLIDALDRPVELEGIALKVALAVGIAAIPKGLQDPRVVLRHAELAAREARELGRNAACLFSPESNAKAEYRRDLSRALRAAIAGEQLTLHYQPIVDVERGAVHSVEALARWEHPQLGFISPGTFIPLVEQMDMITRFGEWAMSRACSDTRDLLGAICPRVSVNVSVSQLQDVNFMHSIFVALEKSGLDPTGLEIEVTESVFANNLERVCEILLELRHMGISIAIDDFGAGYSSLHYLSRLPIDVVKIDGVFVRDFDRGGEAIIGATMSIAQRLQIGVVVEGVETEAMLGNVRKLGASIVQGYLFARPMALSQLRTWLMQFSGRETQALAEERAVAG